MKLTKYNRKRQIMANLIIGKCNGQMYENINKELYDKLIDWSEKNAQNGIIQGDKKWLEIRTNYCGGSSVASLIGKNPYKTCADFISERIGLTDGLSSQGNLFTQWGNLFEDVICEYFELAFNCKVYGADLFIRNESQPYLAYSPDGLTVINGNIVLLEFKCMFSRNSANNPPVYYVPQVKMGLTMIDLPTYGLLVEAVFRCCSWDQLDFNNYGYNLSFGQTKTNSSEILALGYIGFYFIGRKENLKNNLALLIKIFEDEYDGEFGNKENNFHCNDLGQTCEDFLTTLFAAFIESSSEKSQEEKNIVRIWYSPVIDAAKKQKPDYNDFIKFCNDKPYSNDISIIGVLPWKLFNIKLHYIEKDIKYLNDHYQKINSVMHFINICLKESDKKKIESMYHKFINEQL